MKCLNCNLGETREGFATVTLERGQAIWYSSTCPPKSGQIVGKNTLMMLSSGTCLNMPRKRWKQVSSWTSDSIKQPKPLSTLTTHAHY